MKYYTILLVVLWNYSLGFTQEIIESTKIEIDSFQLIEANNYFIAKDYKKAIIAASDFSGNIFSYELIAKSYDKLNDYNKSIIYFEKIIDLNLKKNKKVTLIKNYKSIAKIHKKLRTKLNYKKSVNYTLKALALSSNYKIKSNELHALYNNLGNYYKNLGNATKATESHLKAYSIAKKKKNLKLLQLSLSNLASIHININSSNEELDKAKKYLKESLKYGEYFKFNAYRNLGIVYYLKNKPREALFYHNKALSFIFKIKLHTIKQLPSIKTISSVDKKEELISVLFEKYYAWIKLYNLEKDKVYLIEAMKTIDLSDYTIDEIFTNLKDEKSQLFWRKQASSFYFLGVHISELLKDSEKAFYFTEKNKALLLLNNLKQLENNNSLKLPKEINKNSTKLKKKIYYLRYHSTKNKSDSIKNLLFKKQHEFDKFQDSINKIFPKYNIINNKSLFTVKKLQKNIKNKNKLYISYIWDKTENQYNSLFGVAITKDTSIVFKINHLKEFNKTLNTYRLLNLEPYKEQKDKERFQTISHKLFNSLMPNKVIKNLVKNHTKIIIIPDNDLQNIPFETLIPDISTNNFLIKTHEISYAYSISFLEENRKRNRKPKNSFLGFAPHSFNYDNLESLPQSKAEINTIKTILTGDGFIGEDASKENFFSKIEDYKIVHLSTHANANDSIAPWVAFKNNKLYLNELYTTKNQAELVMLNACNSTLGKKNAGEGVFSLARGFFYSGANSVISSLWNVNDKSNTKITTSFYTYLKDGKTKSAALRQAKLDYLNTHSLSEASPYYWSSLILIGDETAIKFKNKTLIYSILTAFLLVVLFFVLKKIKILGNKF